MELLLILGAFLLLKLLGGNGLSLGSAASLLAPPEPRAGWIPLTYQEIFAARSFNNKDAAPGSTAMQEYAADLDLEQIHGASVEATCGGPVSTSPGAAGATIQVASDGMMAVSFAQGVGAIGGVSGGLTGIAAAGTMAATAIPIVGAVIGAAMSIFAIISKGHAVAVQNEHNVICGFVPAANQSLVAIEQAMMNSTITPQQGDLMLEQLLADVKAAAFCSQRGCANWTQCNAPCEYWVRLSGIVMKKQDRYAAMGNYTHVF